MIFSMERRKKVSFLSFLSSFYGSLEKDFEGRRIIKNSGEREKKS